MNAPARCVCVWSVHVLTDAELSYQYVGVHATCLATHQSVAAWEWMNELADSPDRSTRQVTSDIRPRPPLVPA